MPEIKYNKAVSDFKAGKAEEAYRQSDSMRGYKDADDYLTAISITSLKETDTVSGEVRDYEFELDEHGFVSSYVRRSSEDDDDYTGTYVHDSEGRTLSREIASGKYRNEYKSRYDDKGKIIYYYSRGTSDGEEIELIERDYKYEYDGDKMVKETYADVNGGYTRITKTGPRRGDAAEMCIIELTKEFKKSEDK